MPQSKNIDLFVYGTLKAGFGANNILQPALLKKQEVKLKGYRMYVAGWYPMVVEGGEEDFVVGEIWTVGKSRLKELDVYEGHPTLFERITLPDGKTQMYIFRDALDPRCQHKEDGIFDPARI